jgi:hypothetical protein
VTPICAGHSPEGVLRFAGCLTTQLIYRADGRLSKTIAVMERWIPRDAGPQPLVLDGRRVFL